MIHNSIVTSDCDDVLLTREQAAKFLNVTVQSLNNYNVSGLLRPTHKIGRRILYSKNSILKQIQL
ncbi:MAG: DNA-binding protein [Flavobacterium sp.]|nr:MAG: DNA-binding protein [Flavobacterium sp.]